MERLLSQANVKEALSLETKIETYKHYESFIRIKSSLAQYIESSGFLYYVGLIGGYSSDKSSTINSLLGLWGTEEERTTHQTATDSVITLITHPDNEDMLLGVMDASRIPIQMKLIENNFLIDKVLADTPGLGDIRFTEPVIHDFLPLCDQFLFFINGARPSGEEDLPILQKIFNDLDFVPSKFIVTRLSEFRRNENEPVSSTNLKTDAVEIFLYKVSASLTTALQYGIDEKDKIIVGINNNDFILIDNLASNYQGYNINELRSFLNNASTINKEQRFRQMRISKVWYFIKKSEDALNVLSEYIDANLQEIKEITNKAEETIQKFNQIVQISNSKQPELWGNCYDDLKSEVSNALHFYDSLPNIPESLTSLMPSIIKRQLNLKINKEAKDEVESLQRDIIKEIKSIVRGHLRTAPIMEGDDYFKFLRSIDLNGKKKVKIQEDSFLPSQHLAYEINKLYEELYNKINESNRKLTRILNEIRNKCNKGIPLTKFKEIIANAIVLQSSDLDRHFDQVTIYRSGVFAHKILGSITKVGLGPKLESLDIDFSEEDKEAIKNEAEKIMFPRKMEFSKQFSESLSEISDKCSNDLEEIKKNIEFIPPENFLKRINELSLSRCFNLAQNYEEMVKVGCKNLVNDITIKFQEKYNELNMKSEIKINSLKKERKWRFLKGIFGLSTITIILCAGYFWMNRKFEETLFMSLLFCILSGIISSVVGFFLSKIKDPFPKKLRDVVKEKESDIRSWWENITRNIVNEYEQDIDNKIEFTEHITDLWEHMLFQEVPENWYQKTMPEYEKLVQFEQKVKKRYDSYISLLKSISPEFYAYFNDSNKNLQKLESISEGIKKRRLEPSFDILKIEKEGLQYILNQMYQIKFS